MRLTTSVTFGRRLRMGAAALAVGVGGLTLAGAVARAEGADDAAGTHVAASDALDTQQTGVANEGLVVGGPEPAVGNESQLDLGQSGDGGQALDPGSSNADPSEGSGLSTGDASAVGNDPQGGDADAGPASPGGEPTLFAPITIGVNPLEVTVDLAPVLPIHIALRLGG